MKKWIDQILAMECLVYTLYYLFFFILLDLLSEPCLYIYIYIYI